MRRHHLIGLALVLAVAGALTWRLGPVAHAATTAAVPTEVAVRTGIALDGQVIPLPVYADGTTALESECQWIVSPAKLWPLAGYYSMHCFTSNAIATGVPAAPGRVVNCFLSDQDTRTGSATIGIANYMIIATRGVTVATATRSQSFGQVKAAYR